MATRNTDVNLIIRARNEADRAIQSVSDALQGLTGNASGSNSGLADLGKTIALLDKAFGTVSAKTEQASAAFDRQRESIADNRDALTALERQAEATANTLARLNGGDAIVDAGRDQSGRLAQIKAVSQEQQSLARQTATLTRTIAEQEAALNTSRSSLQRLGSTVTAIESGQREAAAQFAATTQQMERQSQAAQRNATAMAAINRSQYQDSGKSAELSGRAFEASGLTALERGIRDEEEKMEREARELRAALDPLAAIQMRLNAELVRYRQLAAAGKITTDELALAEKRLAVEADQAALAMKRAGSAAGGAAGKIGLFGLKPYELQNLGYQVNDIVTQLASGTSLTQTLAQQGGQVLQLFPRLGGIIIGALENPAILAFVATLGSIVVGLKEAADQAQRLRDFTGSLDLRADARSYDASALTAQAAALERIGAKAKEADAAITEFLNNGVAQDRLGEFATAAQNSAKVLGIDLAAAAKDVAVAFTGGFDAIAQLDNRLNFLTATEREYIRELFAQGNAQDARNAALRIYSQQMAEAAASQRGPWSDAAKSLGSAWDALIKRIANSGPISDVIVILNILADAVKGAADAARELVEGEATAVPSDKIADRIQARLVEIRKLEAEIASYKAAINSGSPVAGTAQRLLEFTERRLGLAQRSLELLQSFSGDTVNGDPNSARSKRSAEMLVELSLEERLQDLRRRGIAGLNVADSQRRASLAGELAFRKEMAATGDAIVAGRLREKATADETRQIDTENARARLAAQKEAERLAKQTRFIDPVDGRVSSDFGPRARPGGVGSSFHRGVDYAVPTGTTVRAPAAGVVVETGFDRRLGKYVLIDHGNNVQSKFGHLSDNSVAREGDVVAQGQGIGRSGNTGSDTTGPHLHYSVLVNGKPVDPQKGLFATDGPSRFETDQGDALQEYEDRRDKAEERSRERQQAINIEVDQGNALRQRNIEALEAEAGLTGKALLDEQKRQTVADAVLALRQRVEDANKSLENGETAAIVTPEQITQTEQLVAVEYDLARARDYLRAQADSFERPLDDLREQRDLLLERAEFLRSIGQFNAADEVEQSLVSLDGKIAETIDKLIAFYRALSPEQRVDIGIVSQQQFDNVIAQLELAKISTQEWGKIAGVSARDIAQAFASSATSAITNFLNKVAAGQSIFKSLSEGIREFAANFIAAIAQMILQLLAYAAAVAILRALGVPVPSGGFGGGGFGGGGGGGTGEIKHGGGIAGAPGSQRRIVDPRWFAAATRYHRGGIAGLAADEVPAILRRGEEVLTQQDSRHRANGGADSSDRGSAGSVTVINVTDPAQALEQALRSPAGEKVLFNHVRDNQAAFRAAISG